MPGYTRLSVYLAACAGGMRIGEVCGLMDTDFDLENKVLMIRRSVSHGADDLGPSRIGRLKTKGSRRTVPIPDMLIPLIRMHLEDRPDQSNHMFFQAKRGEILCQNTLRNHFMKARKAAGRPDLQFRTLRVTHATRLMLDGSSLKETMDALGHVRRPRCGITCVPCRSIRGRPRNAPPPICCPRTRRSRSPRCLPLPPGWTRTAMRATWPRWRCCLARCRR